MKIAESQYGSDKEGLVFGYGFAPGEAGRALQSEAVADWLVSGSGPPDAFAWLHFNLANTASERWLQQHLSLPEGFYRSLHEEPGSSRIELDREWMLAVINDVLFDFDFDAAHVATMSVYVDRRLLVSARCKPLRSVDRLRTAVRQGESFRSPGEAPRRVLVRLQRLLAPEPAALFRLLSRPPAWLGAEEWWRWWPRSRASRASWRSASGWTEDQPSPNEETTDAAHALRSRSGSPMLQSVLPRHVAG